MNFNVYEWHDAVIKKIIIDRNNPGINDSIKLVIQWPENNKLISIDFLDCYFFKADMNFGVIAEESILSAQCIDKSEEINNIKNLWSKVDVNLSELKCYHIITNSTNSVLKIFANDFHVSNL